MNYNFHAASPSDINKNPLGFKTIEEAQRHVDVMNKFREEYETNPIWNKEYWKTLPEKWVLV